jgi:hypothetical protein
MGINQRPGPGESVYRKLGGEAAGEDDVEGHGFTMRASDDEQDTEGHSMKNIRANDDEQDVEDEAPTHAASPICTAASTSLSHPARNALKVTGATGPGRHAVPHRGRRARSDGSIVARDLL